jgi:hypothetical protein
MKKLFFALALLSSVAYADNEMAYTTNKAGGYMFFTYTYCVYTNTGERVPDSFYVYSTDKSGQKLIDGCYRYKYPFYLIEWNKGGNTNINVNSVTSLAK